LPIVSAHVEQVIPSTFQLIVSICRFIFKVYLLYLVRFRR
jgi:hypothetical protein